MLIKNYFILNNIYDKFLSYEDSTYQPIPTYSYCKNEHVQCCQLSLIIDPVNNYGQLKRQ